MPALPQAVLTYLENAFYQARSLAWLVVRNDGTLIEKGGELAAHEIRRRPGTPSSATLFFDQTRYRYPSPVRGNTKQRRGGVDAHYCLQFPAIFFNAINEFCPILVAHENHVVRRAEIRFPGIVRSLRDVR